MNVVRGCCGRLATQRLLGNNATHPKLTTATLYGRQFVRNFPVCSVQTNLTSDQVPHDFLEGLSKVVAKSLSKPEEVISISMTTGVAMIRGGSRDGTVIVEIWSIGVFDSERNRRYSEDFFNYITSQLKLKPDRVALLLHPLKPEDAGHLIYQNLMKNIAAPTV